MAVTSLNATVASNIRAERNRRKMRQVDLAERMNVSGSTISALESGTRPITLDHLPIICNALGVSLFRLLEEAPADDLHKLGIKL
jgi:transcriptional regulator with XRE-family HTH domain